MQGTLKKIGDIIEIHNLPLQLKGDVIIVHPPTLNDKELSYSFLKQFCRGIGIDIDIEKDKIIIKELI